MLRNLNESSGGKRDSTDGRVGVLASEIPTGFPLPAFLLNDVDAGFPSRFYSLEILTLPSAGTLYLDKRGVGSFTGAPDGIYTGNQIVRKYDPDIGLVSSSESTYSLTVGAAANPAPVFGGTLPNISGTAGTAIAPVSSASLFSDTDALTYSASPAGTAWPAGLSINASTGVISGTVASVTTVSGLKVRATDTAAQTVDSNAFSVTIAAPAQVPTVTSVAVAPLSSIITGGTIDFDAIVYGDNNPSQAVTFTADGGTINASTGLFTPPARTYLIQTITITATSVLDPSKSGTATVTILALPIPSEGNPMAQQADLSQLINQTQLGTRAQRALSLIIESLIDDNNALRAGMLQLATKLDQDAGVTDTNYSATVAAALGNVVLVK